MYQAYFDIFQFVAEQPPPGLQSIPDLTRSASKDLIKYRVSTLQYVPS